MTILNILGWLMLALPFVIILAVAFWDMNFWETIAGVLLVIGGGSFLVFWIWSGLQLVVT